MLRSVAVVVLMLIIPCLARADLGNPLTGLELAKPYQSLRASSADPNWQIGNADARFIGVGDTLTLAELEGPGMITHIWCTIAADDPYYSRTLTLRMYWDGEENPSVEVPVGDFFVIGNAMHQMMSSLPVRVTSDGRARNCYWPMPFRKSARITVTNDGSGDVHAFYYYVDWEKFPSLPDDALYFHAHYRQQSPEVRGQEYVFLEAKGRGHYVGTVFSVYQRRAGWFGEGDDRFYIDGAAEPTLRGTGTEDYFCDAWGFRQFDGPFYGVPVWEGFEAGDRGTAYRWHITDPVAFDTSLRAAIERYDYRQDDLSSVAFWYQTEPHAPLPPIPPGAARMPYKEQRVEFEAADARASGGEIVIQQGGYSAEKQVYFAPAAQEATLDVPIQIAEEGDYVVHGLITFSSSGGTWQASLDGKPAWGPADLFIPQAETKEVRLGLHHLTPGEHLLRFECKGKNPASPGYAIGLDALLLRK